MAFVRCLQYNIHIERCFACWGGRTVNDFVFWLQNKHVKMGFNQNSGRIVEITALSSNLCVVKSTMGANLFSLDAFHDGVKARLEPGDGVRILPTTAPEGIGVELQYPCLYDGQHRVAIEASAHVTLANEESSATFTLELRGDPAEYRVHSVSLLSLEGVKVGSPQNMAVLLPYCGGERIFSPAKTLTAPIQRIPWKWQSYEFSHGIGGPEGKPDGFGWMERELRCTGPGSFPWLCVANEAEDIGLSLFLVSPSHSLSAVRVRVKPGEETLGLALVQYPQMKNGVWQSERCTLAAHGGDWHEGVDIWRRVSLQEHRLPQPAWFEQSPGLSAHYDFVYQDGTMVHRFSDLPMLYRRARAQGLDHLLLAGWHEGGFDNGFPEYRPHAALGGADALRDGVHAIHAMGGHVSFYVNVRLCNTRYAHRRELIERGAVTLTGGEKAVECYGDESLTFACMCSQSKDWQDHLVETARYLAQEIGADGLYLDQLALATAMVCEEDAHGERDGWNRGYRGLLKRIREAGGEKPLALMIQGCGRPFGALAAGQLLCTLSMLHSGAFCTLYRYAFPEETLIEMMTPERNQWMQPPAVSRHSTYLIHHAFVHGLYFWVYDLEDGNSFDGDPVQKERLRRALALRAAWLAAYGPGLFEDARSLAAPPQGWMIKEYALAQGRLLACANERPVRGAVSVRWPFACAPHAVVRTCDCPDLEVPTALTWEDGVARIELPQAEMLLLLLR